MATPLQTITESEIAGPLAKWWAAGISNYTYKLSVGCFCYFDHGMPMTTTVIKGASVSVTWADGAAVSNDDYPGQAFIPLATIHGLFNEIERQRVEAEYVRAAFDQVLGFPTDIYVDRHLNGADDEVAYRITEVALLAPGRLPRTGGPP